MSTRCHTIVTKGNKKAYLYRHYDGYPSSAGQDLKNFIRDDFDEIDGMSVNDFAVELHNYEEFFEFENDSVHGDEDYIYFVNLSDRTIKTYRVKEGRDATENPEDLDFKEEVKFDDLK